MTGTYSSLLMRLAAGLLCVGMVACTSQSPATAPDPTAVLQASPPADAAQYERLQDMRKWRNPYLIVRADGVALLDSADSAEIILKPDELLGALAHLPVSAGPLQARHHNDANRNNQQVTVDSHPPEPSSQR